MGDSDFVTQFYNLEGDLISERKKNFFKLLKAQPVLLKEEDLKSLSPRTYLEKLFQIDIFIYFNLSEKLLDVIKEGNAIFISKILKRPLVLKAAIGDISAEEFVNSFLPCTSYALRMKILKKISLFLDDSQMDEIIFWVHKRYGFNIAIKILHTCSSNKIKEFLCNYEVKLKPRQIKFIFDKDPELFVAYLKHHKNLRRKVFKHNNLCRYIAQKNPDLLLTLQREHLISSVNFGRRTSKNFINHNNSNFLDNIEQYSKFLKLDVMVRKLHGNFKEVYFNLFPKEISNLNRNNLCFQLLRFYPKKTQWDLFQQTFVRVFQKNVLENLIQLNSDFVDMFPNTDIMNQWAEIHYDNDKSKPYMVLKYCNTNKAIPLFKEKINVTSSIYDRTNLIKLLVENCGKNKDLKSLESVLQYIWIRHRNEDTILDILYEVDRWFMLEQLNENHWSYINEIIGFLRLKNRLHYNAKMFILGHIEFLCVHGKSYRNEVIAFLKDIHSGCFQFGIWLKNSEAKKQILTEILNVYADKNEFSDAFEMKHLISDIVDFNKEHFQHRVDLSSYPSIMTYIELLFDGDYEKVTREEKELLRKVIDFNLQFSENPIADVKESQILKIFREDNKKGNFYSEFDTLIIKMITKHDRSKFENDVLQLFWEILLRNSNIRWKVITWLCINEPRTIIPHIDKIFSQGNNFLNLENVKRMSHLDLDKKIIDYCINKLKCVDDFLKEALKMKSASSSEGGDTDITKKNIDLHFDSDIIKPLSVLLPTQDYIELVEKMFIPLKDKIEATDDPLHKIYWLQGEVVKCFITTQEPIKVLPTLMKFCLGDFLHFALPSLYSIFYRSPEIALYSYINLLSKRAVSVRKHALFLSCELLDFNSAISILQRTKESNVSSQKHLFSATLKYFRKNPCQELLDMVVQNLNKIDKNDSETLENLLKIKLPRKYTEFYVQKCWYFIESMEKDIDTQKYLESFLKSIITSEDIIWSSPDLCKHIVTHYFREFPEKEQGLQNIYHFVSMVLRYHTSEEMYGFIFNIISEFKKEQRMQPIKCLFDEFHRIALKGIKLNNKIDGDNNYYIELFKQHWFNMFTSTEMFEEHFLLNLLYIKCKAYDKIENYARDMVAYLEEYVAEYGPYVYNKCKKLMIKHTCAPKDKYLFFYNVLKCKNSTLNCILILDLLEEVRGHNLCNDYCYYYDDDEVKSFTNKIIEIVKSSNDPVVYAYLNAYINNE